MKKLSVIWIMLAGLVLPGFAQKPSIVTSNEDGWQKIGEISASFKMENESIVVMGADQFNALKLKVTDAPINIERMQVVYESGKTEDFDVFNQLQAGSETRSITINGNEDIQKVAFTYKSLPNYRGERAHVELYGLKEGQKDNDNAYHDEARETRKDVKDAARNTKKDIEKAADKAGDKISEAAAKAEAEITDQTFEGKMGPQGQKIYIDKYDKYYYVNDDGHKVYISKSELKEKPEGRK